MIISMINASTNEEKEIVISKDSISSISELRSIIINLFKLTYHSISLYYYDYDKEKIKINDYSNILSFFESNRLCLYFEEEKPFSIDFLASIEKKKLNLMNKLEKEKDVRIIKSQKSDKNLESNSIKDLENEISIRINKIKDSLTSNIIKYIDNKCISCSNCNNKFSGVYYECVTCSSFIYCIICEDKIGYLHNHPFYKKYI